MLAPSTPQLARPSRLLGPATAPLVLAIRGGEHDGRLIRIRSAKCTVGSAAGCTLRLRSPGVKPLHCWILRGPGGTVIRRCGGDAQLNGAGFVDAPLAPGYRLRIGPVELEVIRCPVAPVGVFFAPQVPECTSSGEASREAVKLVAQQSAAQAAKLRDEMAQVEKRAAEQLAIATELTNRLANERDALRDEAEALRRETELQRQAATARQSDHQADDAEQSRRQAELAEAQESLAKDRAKLAAQREKLEAQLKEMSHQLAVQNRELVELRHRAEQVGSQSAQMTISMDQLRRTSHEEQSRLESERQALVSETLSLREALGGLTNQLREAQTAQKLLDEAEGERQTLRAEAESLRTQLEQLRGELAENRERLAAESQPSSAPAAEGIGQTVSLFPTDDLAQIRALQERISELESSLEKVRQESTAATSDDLARAQAEFDSQRRQIEENVQAKEQLLNRQAAELTDQLERTQSRQMELDRREEQLREETEQNEILRGQLKQCQAELEERRLALEQQAAQMPVQETPAAPVAKLEEPTSEVAAAQLVAEAPAEEPAAKPSDSQSVESVLSRLVQAGLWRGDEKPADHEPVAEKGSTPAEMQSPASPEPVAEESQPEVPQLVATPDVELETAEEALASSMPASAAAAVSSKPVWTEPTQAPASGDDESIESYMDRLLKRVRGESSGTVPGKPAYQPVPVAQPKAPEPLPEIKPMESAQADVVKPEEYLPRSPAPEQGANLAAMRELANSAARSAIQTHAKHRGGKLATGSFIGFGVCVALSIVMVVFAITMHSWWVGLGALASLVISSYWGFQGARHALGVLKLGKPGDTVAEAAEPAQDATPLEPRD